MLRDSLHTFMLGDDAVFSVYPWILGSPQWQSRSENIEKQSQILFASYQFSLKKKKKKKKIENKIQMMSKGLVKYWAEIVFSSSGTVFLY